MRNGDVVPSLLTAIALTLHYSWCVALMSRLRRLLARTDWRWSAFARVSWPYRMVPYRRYLLQDVEVEYYLWWYG